MLERLTAEFGMGSGLITPQKPPGRRRAKRSNWLRRKERAFHARLWALSNESTQANRAISTGKLHTLLCFHTRPINVVVFHGSQGNARFEVGFPLRCFQRLSRPHIATLQCGWRHNRSTRGASIPVLSY